MTSPEKYSIKQSIPLFEVISEFDEAQINRMCLITRVKAGETILKRNDETSDVFLIIAGTVSVRDYSFEGKEVSYSEIDHGGIFGEFAAIDGGPRSASIESKTETTIARMSARDFRMLITTDGVFGLRVAEHLVAKTRALSQRVFEFGALSVRQRLHAEILRLCDAEPENGQSCTISPAPSHYELATRIATHREAVTKELNRLVSQGIARLERRSITITDLPRLRRAVSGDDVA
ncbi:CRP-like cAMP-binding protein [Labrenzia sp. EL_159]|nr:CRP-like cAMP-binding protein [Labrenzia sp. EL_162]MBG6193110.1 CRP-like cAMP-binding protein [Labrenzia sp. EL_159]